jgi:enoyl-CoA hydratase
LQSDYFQIEERDGCRILQFLSEDGTNRLSRECVRALTAAVEKLSETPTPLIITGNEKFFSAGADLNEISRLGSDAFDFALMGQGLMRTIDDFPATVCAAVYGYCMGGGLDLTLACDMRIAHPDAIFGHRGAALGLITGWGGTQRLPRLVGRGKALEMFIEAKKLSAADALQSKLIDEISMDPVRCATDKLSGHEGR